MPANRFQDKVVLVTGAGRSMGRACAMAFAAEGASVLVNDVNGDAAEDVAETIRAGGGSSLARMADVAVEQEVREMISACRDVYGTVHILVNNAGILRTTRPLEEIPVEEWDLMMAVNVRGVFLCTRHVLPLMKEDCWGRIINVSSSAGRSTSTFGGAHYTASKAAVLGLTRHTAREAAPYSITVNAVAPGSMDTEMVRELADEQHIERETRAVPLGRLGTSTEEADLVTFLASDQASYITGATIDINGGILMI